MLQKCVYASMSTMNIVYMTFLVTRCMQLWDIVLLKWTYVFEFYAFVATLQKFLLMIRWQYLVSKIHELISHKNTYYSYGNTICYSL